MALRTPEARPAPRLRALDGGSRPSAVLIAPFAPDLPPEHLGAAQKIALVARLLDRLGFSVHLLDSSHTARAFEPPLIARRAIVQGLPLRLYRPRRLPSRPVGKLLNLLWPGELPRRLADLRPSLVWLYNSYAFEGRVGLALKRTTGCRLVLELEDLPLARRRGLSPKPLLDHHYLGRLLDAADLVTYINERVRDACPPRSGRSLLFPSILADALVSRPAARRFATEQRYVGYFGGLDTEKGAHTLLKLLPMLPQSWTLVVTGTGALGHAFRDAQRTYADRLEFHGRVEHSRVVQLMYRCDVIVNPHTSIAAMRDGVFPFKVCEALATGPLLVSTPLPSIGVDLGRAIVWYDGSATALRDALIDAEGAYRARFADIESVGTTLRARHSESGILGQLRPMLGV